MENEKIIEKRYIEVSTSKWQRFTQGIIGGLGYGVGITFGTGLLLVLAAFVISKVDFVPVFGSFLTDVIKSAQGNLIS